MYVRMLVIWTATLHVVEGLPGASVLVVSANEDVEKGLE